MGLLGAGVTFGAPLIAQSVSAKPALLGGAKSFAGSWPSWPIYSNVEQEGLTKVLNSGVWGRLAGNTQTQRFESEYSKATGASKALAVCSGTNALFTMLGGLNIGPGDEVIIPPYTFIATYNAVTLNYALPIFADSDLQTFQIDPKKMETAINSNTKALMPVHIGGTPFDVDTVMAIGKKHNIPVIEDACQAHLAEWKGKTVGNWGIGGAFSFQSSKNLNSGEGGAIITNHEDFYKNCYSFHHQGQSANSAGLGTGIGIRGTNNRITEFQSSILLSQLSRLKAQADTRSANAAYLTKMLSEIKGIEPAKQYAGTTKSAYHLYMFRYNPQGFAGMSREKFIQALSAEGVPASTGYGMINRDAFVQNLAKSRHYLKIYGEKRMKDWLDQTLNCPVNDRLTSEAVWFSQTMLLSSRTDMEKIAQAVKKIQRNASKLK